MRLERARAGSMSESGGEGVPGMDARGARAFVLFRASAESRTLYVQDKAEGDDGDERPIKEGLHNPPWRVVRAEDCSRKIHQVRMSATRA